MCTGKWSSLQWWSQEFFLLVHKGTVAATSGCAQDKTSSSVIVHKSHERGKTATILTKKHGGSRTRDPPFGRSFSQLTQLPLCVGATNLYKDIWKDYRMP